MSVGRARAAAVSVSDPALAGCVALVHDAPLVRQNLEQFQSWQRQQLVRLHQRRLTQQVQGPRVPPSDLSIHADADTAHQDQDALAGKARLSTVALTVGADYRLNERWVVGGSLGLSEPRARWRGIGSRVDSHGLMGALYASVSPTERSYVSATATAGTTRHQLTTDLGATGGTGLVEASTRSHEHGLSLMAGVDVPLNSQVTLAPYARLDMVRSRMQSVHEDQGGLRGRTDSASAGLQAQWAVPQPWGVLAPYARVELTRITRWSVTGDSADAYATANGLLPVPHPIEVDRSYGQWALGMSGVLQRGLSVFADVEQGFGNRGVSQWRFTAGLRTEL